MASSDKLKQLVKNKKVALLGIGVTNTPLAYMLSDMGAFVTVHDKKSREALGSLAKQLEEKGISLVLGENYLNNIDADVIFKSPGIRYDIGGIARAVENGGYLTSEMQMFFELCPAKIIAITGSDGKTTTTTLVAKLLERAGKKVYLGGNIGTPLLPLVDEMDSDSFAVVELSSFQLHNMTRSPDCAVITNITPNHLDWHTDMDEYINAKANILRFQNENAVAILNKKDSHSHYLSSIAKGITVYFSPLENIEKGFDIRDGYICHNGEKMLEISKIKLPGSHNVENYMAAIAATLPYVTKQDLLDVAQSFTGVEHRCEFVRELDGVKYYNSSIDSSPTRTIAALKAFSGKVTLLCGGYDKNLDYTPFGTVLCEKTNAVIVTGATKDKIVNALKGCPDYKEEKPELYITESYEESVKLARSISKAGDTVILSPASASFDCFANFMERGRLFKKWVNELE